MGLEEFGKEALRYVGAGGAVAIFMTLVGLRAAILVADALVDVVATLHKIEGILEERNRRRAG